MDYDGDGLKDVLSGSFPGDLYLFRQKPDKTFAAGEVLRGPDDKPLRVAPPDRPRAGGASVVFAHDWDGDRDLDLVGGNIEGAVFLIPNNGSAAAPAYGPAVALAAGGKPVRCGGGDAGPIVADWDGDGRADLLVGGGDGSAVWYRNASTGAGGMPVLADGVVLVPPSAENDARRATEGEVAVDGPGVRAKLCVADYDGDGKTDLLLGDFATRPGEKAGLTKEQVAERDALRARLHTLIDEWLKVAPPEEDDAHGELDAAAPQPGKAAAAGEKERAERFANVQAQVTEVMDKLGDLQGSAKNYGWVWVYLRPGEPTRAASK